MKNNRILKGVFALAVIASVIIACAKEKEMKVAQNNSEIVVVSKEDNMCVYLNQFKEKMQSAEKGDETLSMDDARWHLEAVLNYTYDDAGQQISDIQCDTFCYKMHTSSDKVSLAQLNEAFNAISTNVEKAYKDCTLPNKSILFIETFFENDSKDGDIVVRSIVSTRGFSSLKIWFDSTDYWSEYYSEENHYGNGKCGPYAGQCLDSGAPHELTMLANYRIPQYGCEEGYRLFFTDIEGPWEIHVGDDESFFLDENSPCGYKMYVNPLDPDDPYHNPSHCIPPEDMNYYLSKFLEIAEHYQPSGKVLIRSFYYYDVLTDIPGSIEFGISLKYGTTHCEPYGPDL